MLLLFFYQIALLLCAPWILYRRWKKGQRLSVFWQRLGRGIAPLEKNGTPIVWLHAVSVGETRAIQPLAKALLALPCKPRLVLSSVTEAGHAEAKRLLPEASAHVYLPLDLSYCVNRVLANIQPDLVILAEGDFWLNFLSKARAQGAELLVVNGKLSASSLTRYAYFPRFQKALFSLFSLFCVQNEMYKKRFLQLGVPDEQLKVLGNVKFQAPLAPLTDSQKAAAYKQFALSPDHPVVVIGSTHATEEALICKLCHEVWEHFPTCQFVLAPRHPERSDAISTEIEAAGCQCVRYSLIKNEAQAHSRSDFHPHILLIDQVGVLRDSYALADVAIVAGSFVEHVGGHNILEPALHGKPVLFGPHMWSQQELVDCVLEAQCGEQVTKATLSSKVLALLKNAEERTRMGQAGRTLLQAQAGATERTVECILPYL